MHVTSVLWYRQWFAAGSISTFYYARHAPLVVIVLLVVIYLGDVSAR